MIQAPPPHQIEEECKVDSMFKILRKLDDWRHLPAYQLERRVDIFFGLLLPEFFESAFGMADVTVIPEFPLRKGNLVRKRNSADTKDNRSVKVDFAVFGNKSKERHMYLVELKTDMESLDFDQLYNMVRAKKLCEPFQSLIDGVKQVAKASHSKQKYDYLIRRLIEIDCLQGPTPCEGRVDLDKVEFNKQLGTGKVGLVLVSPKVPVPKEPQKSEKEKILDEFCCISFDKFAKYLERRNREFEAEVLQVLTLYLDRWASVPAGRAASET